MSQEQWNFLLALLELQESGVTFLCIFVAKICASFQPLAKPPKILIKNISHATKLYFLFYFFIHVHRKMGRNSFTTRIQLKKATTSWTNGSFPSHNHWFSSSGLRWQVRTCFLCFSIKLAWWFVCLFSLVMPKTIHVCWMLNEIDQLLCSFFWEGGYCISHKQKVEIHPKMWFAAEIIISAFCLITKVLLIKALTVLCVCVCIYEYPFIAT